MDWKAIRIEYNIYLIGQEKKRISCSLEGKKITRLSFEIILSFLIIGDLYKLMAL